VLTGRKASAAVARGAWPMERWSNRPKPEMTYFAERDFCDITLECLRPNELEIKPTTVRRQTTSTDRVF
jgi:hypothetical protein